MVVEDRIVYEVAFYEYAVLGPAEGCVLQGGHSVWHMRLVGPSLSKRLRDLSGGRIPGLGSSIAECDVGGHQPCWVLHEPWGLLGYAVGGCVCAAYLGWDNFFFYSFIFCFLLQPMLILTDFSWCHKFLLLLMSLMPQIKGTFIKMECFKIKPCPSQKKITRVHGSNIT